MPLRMRTGRVGSWITAHPRYGIMLAILGLFAFSAGMMSIARATDQPRFCAQACHEMKPFHAAWEVGPHASVPCVSCHVDPGVEARLSHKLVAMKEVWVHVSGDPAFPLSEPANVPDARCLSCHEYIVSDTPGFDHEYHAKKGDCTTCHRQAGHEVSVADLRAEGVYSAIDSKRAADPRSTVAAVDGGKANIPGHRTVACTSCHNLEATGCASCHEPRHGGTGPARKTSACASCHAPGERFAFAHPTSDDCGSCHATSESHGPRGTCTNCHTATSGKWAFTHPPSSAQCATCHARPAAHRPGSCGTCHTAAVSWSFAHPGPSSSCTSCHQRPSGHRSGSCTSCHKTATSWSFAHPGPASSCASCHQRPSGHRSGSCTSCHATSSWRFRHPGSTSCATCHSAPKSHYGSSCASCHSPTRAWSSAKFAHPRIPGGEHSSSSFSCSNCHPRSYASYSCIKCHDSSAGPSEGEDD